MSDESVLFLAATILYDHPPSVEASVSDSYRGRYLGSLGQEEHGMWKSGQYNIMRSMRFAAIFCALLAIVPVDPARRAPAAAVDESLYVVTHIDLIPPRSVPGKALLRQFAADTRKDPGATRIELLQDALRPNHYTLVTVWIHQKAFEDHLAADHTRAFRGELQPMLGSPFDERLHHLSP